MHITKIKSGITKRIGKNLKIVCYGPRNKKDYYEGVLTHAYDNIFIVLLDSQENKSFCYCDVLTKNVRLYFGKKEEIKEKVE